jgi:hypothetical protein
MLGPRGYGEEFAWRLEASYPDITELLPRARFCAGTFALPVALFAAEHGDGNTGHGERFRTYVPTSWLSAVTSADGDTPR